MARRNIDPIDGARFVGNKNLKIVHDLDNEKDYCLIDNFIQKGNGVRYENLDKAHDAGMTDCPHCITTKR